MQSILLTHEVFTLTGSDTTSTRLSERQQHLATAHFLKLTGNFYHWAQNQQQSHSSKPQLPFQTGTPLPPRSARCWYGAACRVKHFGWSRDVSRGRWPRGWAAAARLPPAVVQLGQPQPVGTSAVWQRIDAERQEVLPIHAFFASIRSESATIIPGADQTRVSVHCYAFFHIWDTSLLFPSPPPLSCSLASDNRMSPALPSPMALPSPTPSPFYSLFMWKVFK